ncbi:MAG: hypothetical protein WAW61_22385 [Methylococcaceae bacterium]
MIIEIDFKATHKRGLIKKDESIGVYCQHSTIEVDDHYKTLECAKCGKVFEPYEYVLSLATKEDRVAKSINYLKNEERSLIENIEKLKKESRNLKAQINSNRKKIIDTPTKTIVQKDLSGFFSDIKETLK